ncbi:hypothetical protein IIA16_07065, partial [bacterium]|nr:hypothetical protein [bacterium]
APRDPSEQAPIARVGGFATSVASELEIMQEDALARARSAMGALVAEGSATEEIAGAVGGGLAIWIPWNPDHADLEAKVKADCGATIRLLSPCPVATAAGGGKTVVKALFGRAY